MERGKTESNKPYNDLTGKITIDQLTQIGNSEFYQDTCEKTFENQRRLYRSDGENISDCLGSISDFDPNDSGYQVVSLDLEISDTERARYFLKFKDGELTETNCSKISASSAHGKNHVSIRETIEGIGPGRLEEILPRIIEHKNKLQGNY